MAMAAGVSEVGGMDELLSHWGQVEEQDEQEQEQELVLKEEQGEQGGQGEQGEQEQGRLGWASVWWAGGEDPVCCEFLEKFPAVDPKVNPSIGGRAARRTSGAYKSCLRML